MARRYLPDALRSEWSAGCRLSCTVSAKTRIPGLHLGNQMSKRALITGVTGYVGLGVARRLLEDGFEVAVVGDATASAIVPGLDGNEAAQTNYRMLASHVYTTKELVNAFSTAKAQKH